MFLRIIMQAGLDGKIFKNMLKGIGKNVLLYVTTFHRDERRGMVRQAEGTKAKCWENTIPLYVIFLDLYH